MRVLRKLPQFILAIVPLLIPNVAVADLYNGNKMHKMCQENSAVLAGYIAGVIDANRGAFLCIPSEATIGQTRDVMCKYLLENPHKKHLQSVELIKSVMSESFPCE